MMENKDIFVTQELKENDSFDELDFVLYDEFGFDYENGDIHFIRKGGYGYADGTPVKIDSMIEKLQELKERGATHISLSDNCDHHGYDMTSYIIRFSTEEEKQEFLNKQKKEEEKYQKIRELQEEINKIKEE